MTHYNPTSRMFQPAYPHMNGTPETILLSPNRRSNLELVN
jgi:hypothetical protein